MLDNDAFYNSYTRIFGKQVKIDQAGERFFESFYQRFLASSDEVKAAFAHTDMTTQKNMLKKSLLYSMNFVTNQQNFDAMHRIALSHNKQHHNVRPALYDLWLDCMVATAREFDPLFDDDVELAWRLAFSQGITYMKFMYEHSQ